MADDSDTRPGSPGGPLWDPGAVPAATVMVLRDGADGVETLMLRRNRKLTFAGGMWVFPGGRIDPEDFDGQPPADDTLDRDDRLESAARKAASREAAEEAGLTVDPSTLQRWSHWTPPPDTVKRFSTAFYVCGLGDAAGDVVIDDGEIHEHRWQRPAEVLELRELGEIGLTPPTFITLIQLAPFATVGDAVRAANNRSYEHFATRFIARNDEILAMYHGDAGYENGEPDTHGPRHRLSMADRWTYSRDQ